MSKHFRPWNIDQTLLLPPNVRDFVPKDHVSRFIVGLVRESLKSVDVCHAHFRSFPLAVCRDFFLVSPRSYLDGRR
jgi:hypothetical protein